MALSPFLRVCDKHHYSTRAATSSCLSLPKPRTECLSLPKPRTECLSLPKPRTECLSLPKPRTELLKEASYIQVHLFGIVYLII